MRKSVQQAQEGVTQAIRKGSGVQVRGSRLPLFVEILRKLEEHDRKFEEILAEIRALRENQHKLWENVTKLWEEVRSLRLGYEGLAERPGGASRSARRQHRREGKLVLDRRATAQEELGARGRQTRSVADTAAQGSGGERTLKRVE